MENSSRQKEEDETAENSKIIIPSLTLLICNILKGNPHPLLCPDDMIATAVFHVGGGEGDFILFGENLACDGMYSRFEEVKKH